MRDDDRTRPTARPPSQTRARAPHPEDADAECPACRVVAHQFFEGVQVWPASDFAPEGTEGGREMWEALYRTCSGCRSTTRALLRPRPELDGESTGIVVSRREPPSDEVAAIVALLRGAA